MIGLFNYLFPSSQNNLQKSFFWEIQLHNMVNPEGLERDYKKKIKNTFKKKGEIVLRGHKKLQALATKFWREPRT